jgi:signal transduction histidine kinase
MELAVRKGEVEITITDNGRGFDPSASAEGNGLANIRERLARVGGRCQIRSTLQIGSTLSLTLPLPGRPT